MITVSFKRRNLCAQQVIQEALRVAHNYLQDLCPVSSLGYSEKCENCACKQGCRDVYKAAIYAKSNYEMEVYKNENY